MKKTLIMLLSGLLLTSGAALAQETTTLDPIVVTATRTATPLSQIASSVTVISAEEIEEKQQNRVIDVLRSVPGVNIVQSGSVGGQTSVFLRGTDSRHTLVLIDGIEYRDVSTIGGIPRLEHLTTDNVAQIEVVRGAQSVLYGSDAIGGVINIITKKGGQPSGFASVEAGSYNTWIEKAGFSVGSEKTSASFAVSRLDSDGFSAANEKDGNTEDDGLKNTNFSLNLGAQLSETFEFRINAHVVDSENEIDSYASGSFADSDAEIDSQEKAARVEGIFHLYDERWQLALGSSFTDNDRTGTGSGWYDNYTFDGETAKFDVKNTIEFGSHVVVIGAETEKEEFKSSSSGSGSARNNAVFAQEQFNTGDFSAAIGVRYDHHNHFGSEVTWRVAPTYTIAATGTRLKGSVGTGFKAPSLFHLYYPYGGNENLDAETSRGWDLGVEQQLLDSSVIVAVTWFYNDIDDYIDWYDDGDYDFFDGDGYRNIDSLETSGVESTVEWYPNEILDFKLGYTYTDAKENDTTRKVRIPLHKGTFDVNLYPLDDVQVNLNLIYTGERDDTNNRVLDSYTLVNLAASWQVSDNFKVFSRVDNLFDKEYEEVSGYGTAGLSAYAGVKLTF